MPSVCPDLKTDGANTMYPSTGSEVTVGRSASKRVCADTGLGESPPADHTKASATAVANITKRLKLIPILHPSREHGKLAIVPNLFIEKVLVCIHSPDAGLIWRAYVHGISRNSHRYPKSITGVHILT